MSATRAEIRREAADRLDGRYFHSTATGGSIVTLIDTVRLQDSGASADEYEGGWLIFDAGTALAGDDNVRTVNSYIPGTGQVAQAGAAWSEAPTGMGYELHGLIDPRDWNSAINRGLRRCTRVRRERLTLVDDRLNYSLAALGWLESRRHVQKLLYRHGENPTEYRWEELNPALWEIVEDDDALTLDLIRPIQAADGRALFIEAIGPYGGLDDDLDTTSCPFDWVVTAALQAVWERHARQIDSRATTLQDRLTVTALMQEQVRIWAPKLSRPVDVGAF